METPEITRAPSFSLKFDPRDDPATSSDNFLIMIQIMFVNLTGNSEYEREEEEEDDDHHHHHQDNRRELVTSVF